MDYTSDFLDFTGTSEGDFSLAFSSWITNATGAGLSIDPIDNFFASATASAAGTFDSDTNPIIRSPEPATITLGAIGLVGLALAHRRKRTRRTAAA